MLPEVAVIDFHGLNDAIIARNPIGEPPAIRLLAHERTPPPGYVDCFQPNVEIEEGSVNIKPRPPKTALTDDQIRGCEAKFRARQR